MESLGGTLGLIETQNADLTSNSGSNNLDIHMHKNTEYGAMALLSASSYGNPSKIEDGGTTTGNETGVKITSNYEWTAAQHIDYYEKTSYNDRYINYYQASGKNESKRGDAFLETKGWHGSTYVYAINGGSGAILRKGIFGFHNQVRKQVGDGFGGKKWVNDSEGSIATKYTSRAVIINGEGI